MDGRSREARAAKAAAAANASAGGDSAPAERSSPSPQSVESTPTPRPSKPSESSGNVEGKRPEPRNEPRRKAMEEITNRHMETSGYEPVDVTVAKPKKVVEEQAPEPTPPTAETILAAHSGQEQAPAATPEPAADPVTAAVPAVEMVRAKVDGVEFDVPKAEVEEAGGIVAYQKGKAAENRLAKANETLAQTRQTQAHIAAWIQAQTPKQPTITDDQFIQQKVDVIRFGTPEESAQALREVTQKLNPQVDVNALRQSIFAEINQKAAVDNFKKEFQDVVTNPMLLRLAVSLENERKAQADPNIDWSEFYRRIGNEVRSVTGRPNQPTSVAAVATPSADQTSQATTDREARKSSIVNLPTAAARAALPTEAKPETRDELLNRMRKARGIPTG